MSEARFSRRRPVAMPRLTPLAVLVPLACLSVASAARAQGADAAPAPQASAPASQAQEGKAAQAPVQTMEVVTVNATRRREPMREVPMQVDTVSAEKLQTQGARQLTDYLANEPGVNVSASGAGQAQVAIRGVTTGAQTSATVGMYIDDVAFGSSGVYGTGASSALEMSLLDLNHIEVLRGPQGTLYGASAMGGLIKYVTNEPDTYALSGRVSLGASLTQNGAPGATVSGVVNVPLKEDVAGLRVAAFHSRAGGWVDAVGPAAHKNVNGGETTGGRVSLLVEPVSRFKVRLTALSQTIERDGSDNVDYSFATGRPVSGDLTRSLSLREPYRNKIELASADIEYDFKWARLNSITSYQTVDLTRALDYSSVYAPFVPGVETVPVSNASSLRKKTQELRLTSASSKSFEWIAGLFFTQERGTIDQRLESTMAGGAAGPELIALSVPSRLTESAFYGDVTWKPATGLAVTLGARVSHNKQSFEQDTTGLLVGGGSATSGESSETSRTYLATVSYALSSTSNAYFRAASGYRPGGPNPLFIDPDSGQPLVPPAFQHDSLWSYELGYKADLLDKTLSLHGAVYDIVWKDIQQFTSVNGIGAYTNAGRADIKGVELGAQWRPTRAVDVNASLAYTHSELKEGAPGLGAAGSRLPYTPKFSASLGATYNFDLAGHSAWVGATGRHVGDQNAGFEGSASVPNWKIPSYSLFDLQAGVNLSKWQVSLYVRNLTNKQAILSASTTFVPLNGPVQAFVVQPRTVGLTVSTDF